MFTDVMSQKAWPSDGYSLDFMLLNLVDIFVELEAKHCIEALFSLKKKKKNSKKKKKENPLNIDPTTGLNIRKMVNELITIPSCI